MNNNIKHIKCQQHHPQNNGVVEVVHKEIRKYVILKYVEDSKDFDLNNVLLEVINAYNHNIHTSTGFKPFDIINNTNEEIKNKFLLKFEHSLKYINTRKSHINK